VFSASIEGSERKYYESPDLPNRAWRVHEMTTHRTAAERPNSNFTIVNPKTGEKYPVNPNAVWRVTRESFEKFYKENRVVFPGDYSFLKISKPVLRYFKDDDEAKAGEQFGFVAASTNLPKEVGMTQDGTKDIGNLFDNKIFGFPKPVNLIKHLIKITTSHDKSAIILDFFAGSGTTAQSLLEFNREDNGNRKFILVQLPELTDNPKFPTIAEISKERIRRAIKQMQSERKGKFKLDKQEVDLGFKVLKLSRSNYQAWQDYDGEDVKKLETLFDNTTSPLVDDWQPQAVRTEIMLLEGFPLDSAVTVQEAFKKNKVMLIESDMVAHRLFVCLDKSIKDDTIQSLELRAEDVFVCLDSALSDEDKVRLSDMGNLRVI